MQLSICPVTNHDQDDDDATIHGIFPDTKTAFGSAFILCRVTITVVLFTNHDHGLYPLSLYLDPPAVLQASQTILAVGTRSYAAFDGSSNSTLNRAPSAAATFSSVVNE